MGELKKYICFFYFKTYQGGKNAFLTISEEKLHRWRKIWRIRREVWTSRRFLGASCVWQHLQLFLYSMSLTIGSTVAPFCGRCPSSGVCLMVRLGWGGWIWWARLQWWIDLLVISYQGYTITWFTATDVDLDHLAEVSWVLPCQVMPHLIPPLDFSPTGIPLLSPSYIQDHLCIPVPPLVASSPLKTPHSPHPVPVMHHVIIISRTKITWSHDQRPSTIISTQTQTSLGK